MKYTSSFIITALTIFTSVATASTPAEFDKYHEKLSQEIIAARASHQQERLNAISPQDSLKHLIVRGREKLIDNLDEKSNIFKQMVFNEIDTKTRKIANTQSFIEEARKKIKELLEIKDSEYDDLITIGLSRTLALIEYEYKDNATKFEYEKKKFQRLAHIIKQNARKEIERVDNEISDAVEQAQVLLSQASNDLTQVRYITQIVTSNEKINEEINKVKKIGKIARKIKNINDVSDIKSIDAIYETIDVIDKEYSESNILPNAKKLKESFQNKHQQARKVIKIFESKELSNKQKFTQLRYAVQQYVDKDTNKIIDAFDIILNKPFDSSRDYTQDAIDIANIYQKDLGKDGARFVKTVTYLHQATQIDLPSDLSKMSMQDMASAAPAVLGLVSAVTGKNTPKELQAATGLLMAYATGNPMAAISSIGGLLGGGRPDPAAARHAEIMKQFAQVNKKLDELLEGQKKILAGQKQIREDIKKAVKTITDRIDQAEKNIIYGIEKDNEITRMQLRDVYVALYEASYEQSFQKQCDLHLNDTLLNNLNNSADNTVSKWLYKGFQVPNFCDENQDQCAHNQYHYNRNFTEITHEKEGFANCFTYFQGQRASFSKDNIQQINITEKYKEYNNIFSSLLDKSNSYYDNKFIFYPFNKKEIETIAEKVQNFQNEKKEYQVVNPYNLMRLVGVGTTLLKYSFYSTCNQRNFKKGCDDNYSYKKGLQSDVFFKNSKKFLENLRDYLLYSYYQQSLLSGASYVHHTYHNQLDATSTLNDWSRTVLFSNAAIAKNFFTKLCYQSDGKCLSALQNSDEDITQNFSHKSIEQILGHKKARGVIHEKDTGKITITYMKCENKLNLGEKCNPKNEQKAQISFIAPTVKEIENIDNDDNYIKHVFPESKTAKNVRYTIKYLDGILRYNFKTKQERSWLTWFRDIFE